MIALRAVIDGFGRKAQTYDAHADVQFRCAARLADFIAANVREKADGPILEVGCGTGIFTARLQQLFPDARLTVSDPCAEMLDRCRRRLAGNTGTDNGRCIASALQQAGASQLPDNIDFVIADAGSFAFEQRYSLAAAAFTLQWVPDLEGTLDRLLSALCPGGRLFFSLPTAASFPEWKQLCLQAAVTCTANPLPEAAQFRAYAARTGAGLTLYEEAYPVHHQSFDAFLHSLKSIGAGTTTGSARLSLKETRRLLRTAGGKYGSFTATYRVLFGYLERPT